MKSNEQIRVDAEKILSQDNPTGWDLGRLEVSDALNYVASSLTNGRRGYFPLIEDKQHFKELVYKLSYDDDDKNALDYSGFVAIHKWTQNNFMTAKGYIILANNALRAILSTLEACMRFEELYKYLLELDNIAVTQNYEEIKPLTKIDKKGNIAVQGLVDFNEQSILQKDMQEKIKENLKLYKSSVYFVHGYQQALLLIGKTYDIAYADEVNQNLGDFVATWLMKDYLLKALDFTKLIPTEKDNPFMLQKLRIIKEITTPIDAKETTPSKEKIKQAQKAMKDGFKIFYANDKGEDELANILCHK